MTIATRIPAIPTTYNGIKFRSKLEAKYAQGFDLLKIPWVYEEVNFKFDDGIMYAPDFYFPDSNQFFEVKGFMENDDYAKIMGLVYSGHDVVVGFGAGNMTYYNGSNTHFWNKYPDEEFECVVYRCPICGKWSFSPDSPLVCRMDYTNGPEFYCSNCNSTIKDGISCGYPYSNGFYFDKFRYERTYANLFRAVGW